MIPRELQRPLKPRSMNNRTPRDYPLWLTRFLRREVLQMQGVEVV